MSTEEREELSEFGYRETDDPDEADRRNYYKVEKWSRDGHSRHRAGFRRQQPR
jgi:hypothetical protein